MRAEKMSIIPGFLLIVIGLWLFLQQIGILNISWSYLWPIALVLLGFFMYIHAVFTKQSGNSFWGIALLILGFFFILKNYNVISDFYFEEYWPIFPFSAGMGFFVQFIHHRKEWGVLIPGSILLFIGISAGLNNFNIYYFDWLNIWHDYWPTLIIFSGIVIIVKGLFSSHSDNSTPQID